MTKSKWKSVVAVYIDHEEKKLSVDAWKTDSMKEEGRTIAKIDIKTGAVEYFDKDAITDWKAQKVIMERASEYRGYAQRRREIKKMEEAL